jgi:hypothetical protein
VRPGLTVTTMLLIPVETCMQLPPALVTISSSQRTR